MTGEPKKLTCLRCGHAWWSFLERPAVCPKCKHYHWDTPKESKKLREPRRQPAGVQEKEA